GKQVCYKPFGCFSNGRPFNNMRRNLPDSPQKLDIRFLLYTTSNRETSVELRPLKINEKTLGFSPFIPESKTIFIIHGFSDRGSSDWILEMKNELLKLTETVNVIVVDWRKGAAVGYLKAGANTRVVGAVSGYLLKRLHYVGKVKYPQFHIIGHDLGAQVAGYIGEAISCIPRITGLDPSGFGFENVDKRVKLDPEDAAYVDVIRTNCGSLIRGDFGGESRYQVGTVDFYVNGGISQPGCSKNRLNFRRDILKGNLEDITKVACSHMRAVEYFTSSITKCNYQAHVCPEGPRVDIIMGYHSIPGEHGKFCVETEDTEPFCVSHWNHYRQFSII
ncbi:hypothetical protein LOTGIDRAFT_143457, partial [Lottia gigantea]